MGVLWWWAPPLVATCLAMAWVAWRGRERNDVRRRDDSDEALRRMQEALARPVPRRGTPVASRPVEPTHGVAVRRSRSQPVGARPGAR